LSARSTLLAAAPVDWWVTARVAEKFRQTWAPARETREYETAVDCDPRRALHRAIRVRGIHSSPVITLLQWNSSKGTVEVKTPCVIRANEARARVARHRAAQLHAAMRAPIVQDVDPARGIPDHDHRLMSDLNRLVIPGRLDLGLVSAIHPDLFEDLLYFAIEYLRIRIDGSVNAIGFN